MLEQVLSLALHLIELCLAVVYHHLLSFDILAQAVEFVARALVFALLLVELQLALFHFGLNRLQFRHFLRCLFLRIRGNLQRFLASFEHLVAFQVFGLALSLGHYLLSPCVGHAALHYQGHHGTYGGGNDSNGDVIQYHLSVYQMNVNKKRTSPNIRP